MNRLPTLEYVSIILIVVGGLNWGLVGIANFNLISALLGVGGLARIIYALVGIAAIYVVINIGSLAKK